MKKTITRREHWRWQRCGVGRTELRHILVRQAAVTLNPDDTTQLDMLAANDAGALPRGSRRRASTTRRPVDAPRAVLRSYWRHQRFGPRRALTKLILVDVTR